MVDDLATLQELRARVQFLEERMFAIERRRTYPSVVYQQEMERYQVYVDYSVCTVDDAMEFALQEFVKVRKSGEYSIFVVEPDPVTGHQAIRLEWPSCGLLKTVRRHLKKPINLKHGLSTIQPRGAKLYSSTACKQIKV